MSLVRSVRWRLALAGVMVLALTAAGVAWAVEWTRSDRPDQPAARPPAGSGVPTGITAFRPGDQPVVPAVSGDTLDGDRLALADLRGHVVVVNVWGSWCVPCREEAPHLARVARETRDDGVRFVGINTRDRQGAARAFVRDFGIPYPSLSDPDGKVLLALDGIIPVNGVPSTLVINPDGRVAVRVVGQVTYPKLRGLVDHVVAERASRPSTPSRSDSG